MNLSKSAKVLAFIVALTETIIAINEIWKSIEPNVKKVISSLVEYSLKLHQEQGEKTIVREVKND